MRVAKLTLKAGGEVELPAFTILVGPNNVGKSQTLRDIAQKIGVGPDARSVLVEDLDIPKPPSLEAALEGLTIRDDPRHIGQTFISGIGLNLQSGERIGADLDRLQRQFETQATADFLLPTLGRFRVSHLDASSRLSVAEATQSIDAHSEPPQRLLQALYVSGKQTEGALQKAFEDTFGMQIRLDYSGLTRLVLRVASEFPEIPADPREAHPIMAEFQTLDSQGDGFRSFVGVVLSLLLSHGRVILLDEPEAFLHPAQARLLGSWIGRQARDTDNQILVATHNAHFLRGILDSGAEAGIFRLNRSGDQTDFVELPAQAIEGLTRSPLLSGQSILEAVFHRGVVVTEADSDRSVYHAVGTRELGSREILFIHAHNKQTIHEVISLLRTANIPTAAVVDVDIMNSGLDLERLLTALGEDDPTDLLALRDTVAESVEGKDSETLLSKMCEDVEELAGQLRDSDHTLSGARSALRRIDAVGSRWRQVKRAGLNALQDGVRASGEQLVTEAKSRGLFIVPTGELESWMDLGTRRKKQWIVRALRQIHDEGAPRDLLDFVREILQFLGEEVVKPGVG